MKLLFTLSVFVVSLFVAGDAGAESWSKQLNPKNTGDELCTVTVTVNRIKDKEGEFLKFQVKVKGFDSKELSRRWGELRVMNGKEFVSSSHVQSTGSDGDKVFTFRIAEKYVEKSSFTFTQTNDFDHISHWFYLKDFVESK